MTPEPDANYSSTAITLHWLTATLVVANLLLGLSMVPLPISPQKLEWYIVHKWIGISIFLVTWPFKLEPSSTKSILLKYKVKYPKGNFIGLD